jgi:hypothetical protein
MSLANYSSIIPSARNGVTVKGKQRGNAPTGRAATTRTKQAFKTFYSSGKPAFTVSVKKSFLKGAKSNIINVGIYLQSNTRYIITCFDDVEAGSDKFDGNLSTAALGDDKVTSKGIVDKINDSGAMNIYLEATLHNTYTNVDYTGNTGIGAGDAQATGSLGGGRG